ncbi:PQ-loop domain-containing transporter [Pseudoxanthomonas sp. SGT-18]|uniref:PQ-loop domain-containing transporter n=1 Tax=Pseudoxanthomonas sp. SGT-18 TaxID=2493087 RepID=UPI001F0CB946|nr:PQ-loop domain-containing transporter [Pseudoxanthomonas sp. SGT-18]
MSGHWLGFVAATLTTVAFVPQALKTLRSRDTRGICLGMYVVFTVGLCFWLAYGSCSARGR